LSVVPSGGAGRASRLASGASRARSGLAPQHVQKAEQKKEVVVEGHQMEHFEEDGGLNVAALEWGSRTSMGIPEVCIIQSCPIMCVMPTAFTAQACSCEGPLQGRQRWLLGEVILQRCRSGLARSLDPWPPSSQNGGGGGFAMVSLLRPSTV
jgi:hypothetical protein